VAEISIEGRRVFYFECGSGAPIVLLHAGAGSGKQWTKTARLLEPRFRVIAPDLWGFGGTESWAGEPELTHDHQASLVADVIQHLCQAPVHLVGHSYGGATAVRLMLRNRDLVQSTVLIEPILPSLLESAGETRLFREYLEVAQSFLRNAAAGDGCRFLLQSEQPDIAQGPRWALSFDPGNVRRQDDRARSARNRDSSRPYSTMSV